MRIAACLFTFGMLVAGCATRPDVIRTDLTHQSGLYVVAFTTDPVVRRSMEDQLVRDLRARGLQAWVSHGEIPELESLSYDELISASAQHDPVAIVLVNQVVDADAGLSEPQRVTPVHPDLRTYLDRSSGEARDGRATDGTVVSEVNLFLLDGAATRLYWHGTTWSMHADGRGTAIRDMSGTIADQLESARREFTRNAFER